MTGGPWEKLPREFYLRDTLTVARDLLGRWLVRRTPEGLLRCRITETEAYCGPSDPACHSSRGSREGRTSVMYRGAQPLEGLSQMARNRRLGEPARERDLLSGPGKLCQALAIDRGLYGEPLWGDRLWLCAGEPFPEDAVAATPRINIDYAGEAAAWPWRFVAQRPGRPGP